MFSSQVSCVVLIFHALLQNKPWPYNWQQVNSSTFAVAFALVSSRVASDLSVIMDGDCGANSWPRS